MSIINNICEHGQLERKCEVCELKAEIARLRSVCRLAAWSLTDMLQLMDNGSRLVIHAQSLIDDLNTNGKEPSDGL